jgi:SAM-dependent methyltransferase
MGAFVAVAREAGLVAHGTEMAPMAVKKANELFGVSLHLGDIDSLPGDEQYDAVVLWDVIEHCPRPDLVLRTVSQRVRPNGKVILTTGNYESHDRIWSGKDWWCWHQDHYHYFSPSGMAALAARFGLGDLVVSSVPRIRAPADPTGSDQTAAAPKKSNWRFLSPSHLRGALHWKAVKLYSRLRHPAHSEIGIMLCVLTRKSD